VSKEHPEIRPAMPSPRALTTRLISFPSRPHYQYSLFSTSSSHRAQTHRADVLIVGSGCAGLSAALRCHQHGLKPLVIEKSDKLGGTSAWSGGGLWIPLNEQYAAQGIQDNEEAALRYLDGLIGDVGPASSPERRLAYVRNAHGVISELSKMGMRFVPTVGMPDYHTDVPGSVLEGRSIEPAITDAKLLRDWRELLNPPTIFAGPPMQIYEGMKAAKITSLGGVSMLLKILLRWAGLKIIGREPVGLGQALIAQFLMANMDRGTEIWRSAALKDLTVDDDGKVSGATVVHDGNEIMIDANAVVLTAGGFAKNDEMRRKYHQQPTDASWSSVTSNDTGDAIQASMAIGADTALMEHAWWNPTFLNPVNGKPFISFGERGRPHSIIVDSEGERFMNESDSYNDVGARMYERNSKVPAIPAWLIMDKAFIKRNPLMGIGPRIGEKDGLRINYLYKAASLEELTQKINVDTEGLLKTVERFNGFARQGKDLDFGRGQTAMDRMSGDETSGGRNPNLGPIEKPPFYAIRIYPGDIGTKGGLLTDEHARVLDKKGKPIRSLYAAGNTSASVMGKRYAGAGATIGPAVVFAALAVDHAAGKPWSP
jgi:helvolic acid biosynthesis 3-ketosteroid Delta1-dehydrogenase